MDHAKFTELVNELAPMHRPEAVAWWMEFASERVERGQFVHFESTADKTADEEKWLDAFYAGFCAVKESFGQEMATAVIDLSCQHCCLYPGEMMQAAVCLAHGKNAGDIMGWINSGDLDPRDLFASLPRKEAEEDMAPVIPNRKESVVAQLKGQPNAERKKAAPKKSAEKER